jgi:hypothetical protein
MWAVVPYESNVGGSMMLPDMLLSTAILPLSTTPQPAYPNLLKTWEKSILSYPKNCLTSYVYKVYHS